MIKTSFLDWCDTKGFYVKNVWDLEKGKWIGPGYMQWFPWQRRIFRHVFTPNEHGILPYSTIVISQAKKSGKSIIGSAVGAWVAEEGPDHSEIYPVANDQEQASRLYEDVVYHAEKSYQLRGTKKELEFPNGSKIVPLAQHYSSAAGTRHILSLWDELWAYTSERSQRMWTEMTPPPTIPGAFRLVVTYAGFENESTLLWNLYEENWLKGTPIPQLSDMVNTQGDPVCRARGKTFVFWDDQHRLPWQTEEYYDDQRRQLRPADFLRIHCNMWVSSADTFITDDLLDSREVLSGPLHSDPDEKKRRMPIWVGVDVAPKHDSCAVVAVGMDEAAGRIRLADYRIFYPDASKQIFDINETVTETVKQFHQMYNLQAVYYDPYQFHQPSVDLRKFGVNMIEFNQTVNNMTEVTQALFESLNTATLDFYRAPDLVDHLKYATAKATPRGFRLVKQKNAKYKIDAAVALAMAVFAAIYGSFGRVTGVPMTIDFPYSDVAEQVAPKDPEWLPFELRR